MGETGLTGIVALGLLIAVSILYKSVRRSEKETGFKSEKFFLEELTLEEVISWANQHSDLMKESPDYTMILLKGDSEISKSIPAVTETDFTQCVFDKETGEIIVYRIIQTNKLNAEIVQMFGEKDMVVFQ